MTESRVNRRKRRRNQQPDWLLRILGGAFVIVGIITAVLVFQYVRKEVQGMTVFDPGGVVIIPTPDNSNNGDEDPQGGSTIPDPPIPEVDRPGWDGASRVNILIMGLDFSDWRAGDGPPRTDTMILFTYDPNTEKAAMLSIPRDLWVNVPGFGQNKINSAYFLGEGNRLPGGGRELAAKTVEEFLGIDIHYYAVIDFYVFIDFIDFIGGVCVEITEPIKIDVIDKKNPVTLIPPKECMKGAHLLGFIRARHITDGDIGRAQNQQRAIIAIKDKLTHPDIQVLLATNPIEIWNIFSAGIVTNIAFDEAWDLGNDALKINPASIGRYVISVPEYGSYEMTPDGAQTIIKPRSQKIRELRDEIFGEAVGPGASGANLAELMKEEAAAVAVYNGSGISGLAGSTEEYLNRLGVNVVEVGNADYVSSTTIYDYTGNPYTVQFLVDLLGISNTRIFNSYDPNSTIDVSIVLGSEWSVP